MSESEDELDFLADSGSEYEPSDYGDDTDGSISAADFSQDDADSSSDYQGRRRRDRGADRKRRKVQHNGVTGQSSSSTGQISYKAFGEFMNDVVFSISGFVNPLRAELRSKCMEMGARYKPDWDDSCTHLICAFRDTPKYNQVRGHGKIVKKEWIEDCHSSRKRFPWRRYALDKRDGVRNESEDELHELTAAANTTNSQRED